MMHEAIDLSKLRFCDSCGYSVFAPICSVVHQARYIEVANEIRRREGLPPRVMDVPDWLPVI